MDKHNPQIRVSEPHFSKSMPGVPHVDIDFVAGKAPGQLPIPFPRIHAPYQEPPCQPDFRSGSPRSR